MKFYTWLLILFFIATTFSHSQELKHNYIPPEGYAPNKETAIKIAIALLEPIYGKEDIGKQTPFTAILKNEVWYIKGSIKPIEKTDDSDVFVGHAGGVAKIEISKKTGEILRVSHGA